MTLFTIVGLLVLAPFLLATLPLWGPLWLLWAFLGPGALGIVIAIMVLGLLVRAVQVWWEGL